MAGMDLLNKIGSTVTEAGKDGIARAKELRDTARITIEIRDRENAIHKAYRELGKAYYREHKHDASPAYEQVTAIKALFEELGELKATKDEIKAVREAVIEPDDEPVAKDAPMENAADETATDEATAADEATTDGGDE